MSLSLFCSYKVKLNQLAGENIAVMLDKERSFGLFCIFCSFYLNTVDKLKKKKCKQDPQSWNYKTAKTPLINSVQHISGNSNNGYLENSASLLYF